ncbi:hypothetical protein ACJJTC_019383 [Scirpophaga incertulas]
MVCSSFQIDSATSSVAFEDVSDLITPSDLFGQLVTDKSNTQEDNQISDNDYISPSGSEMSCPIAINNTDASQSYCYVENSDLSSNISENVCIPKNIFIPPSDSDQSYIMEKQHTTKSYSFIEDSDLTSNITESIGSHENQFTTRVTENNRSATTDNSTSTSQTYSYVDKFDNSMAAHSNNSHNNMHISQRDQKDIHAFTNNYLSTSHLMSSYSTPIKEKPCVSAKSNISKDFKCNNSDNDSIISPGYISSSNDESDRDATFYPTAMDLSSESSDKENANYTLHSTDFKNEDKTNKKDKTRRERIKDFCFYCETGVLNFARHVIRNHTTETEVQKILAYPKKSIKRKNLLTALRKKGNYITNVSKCVKPMKKSNIYPNTEYLPCEVCLGFYARKQLWKHKKRCHPKSQTNNTQVIAQNFMLRHLPVDKKLKSEIFPKMRPDRVSLEAKQDPLICAFGAQYMRIHREKHFINVTSRKMRELAKLLIQLKTLRTFKDLMDVLKPQNYDLIVTATKKVSSYDDKIERYGAPTYALNISTSIKQCCNIAIMATLKSGTSVENATLESDLKTLIQLIEANWKYDISSQACSDLNLKKWNKITIIPLASDLKLLKDHLREQAKNAAFKLRESQENNIEAYNSLLETVYCRIILLNRRRPGELQRLLLSTYQDCNNSNNSYEEFDRVISSAEKYLVKSFKRIVIRGKRGRGVPVLLSDDVQSDIDLLISVRSNYIPDNNNYLFAKPGCQTPLCGYKVVAMYAKSCGAKNPKAITTTKLRKHLATLTQMLNLKDTDIEQLANFMGHTQAIHRQNYRLPDDIYQTAKISKLLLLMENGKADVYKGQSLDDINIDLEEDLLREESNENDEIEDIMDYDDLVPNDKSTKNMSTAAVAYPQKATCLLDTVNATKEKKKRTLVPWTEQQKNIVLKFFNKHIKSKQPPKRHECEKLRNQHPATLHNKDWLKIKVFVQNTYTKK